MAKQNFLKIVEQESKDIKKKVGRIKNKKNSIKNFRDRDFSEYCEYVVAFKLQELGWKVFQPLVDRYIDIVAIKKISKNKILFRTIQVKSSRIELGGEKLSYGLTHKPKDLMHDSSHFFIWLFYDTNEKENFIILSVSDFIELMGKSFFRSMSWRKGNCRIHFLSNIKKIKLSKYFNKWENLIKGGNSDTYKLCIDAQEADGDWKSKNAINKWRSINRKIIKKIPPYMMKRIKRKIEIED